MPDPFPTKGGVVQKDYIIERLKFLTEFFKLCWLDAAALDGTSEKRHAMILEYLAPALAIVAMVTFAVVAWKIIDNT